MLKKKLAAIAITGYALLAVLGTHPAMAQDAATPYPKMAPIDQYLMGSRQGDRAGSKRGPGRHLARRIGDRPDSPRL